MISIIIPVYNVEKYLSRCINSILSQSYKDLEIILVDDGSPDNSPRLCDEIAQKDSRVVVIHKSNGGLSSARNAGLDIAKGEYIFFVDSDDWLSSKEVLEQFYNKAIENNSSFVFGLMNSATDKTITPLKVNNRYKEDDLFLLSNPYLFSACNKLYKKELFKNIRFELNRVNEDVDIIPLIFQNALNPICLREYSYCYYINTSSITRSVFNKKRFDMFKSVSHVYKEFDGTNKQKKIFYQNLFGFQIFSVYLSILKSSNKKENLKEFVSLLKYSGYNNYFYYCFSCFLKNDTLLKSIKKNFALIFLILLYSILNIFHRMKI